MASYRIERLAAQGVSDADVRALGALLVDAVDSDAAVSFLAPFGAAQAEAWWRKQLEAAHPRAVFLVARDEPGEIVGTVQLQPAWAPNQPHRAEVCKMIVHRRARGGGLARLLMDEVERAAWDAGFTLLVLDTKKGCGAERLYEKSGWTRVGAIPSFAVDPDGVTPHATVVFYKDLRRGREKTWRDGELSLRPTVRADLDALFAMQADPEASVMAGVKPRTREAFDAMWEGIFANAKVIPRTIEWYRGGTRESGSGESGTGEIGSGEIVGIVNVFQSDGADMVGYTVARRHWGKGIASRALRLFLDEVTQRPLVAEAAADNAGSLRVLERCGFVRTGVRMGEETDRYIACELVHFVLE
jgi:RimJ/RimL family protein N-acetyltransferase